MSTNKQVKTAASEPFSVSPKARYQVEQSKGKEEPKEVVVADKPKAADHTNVQKNTSKQLATTTVETVAVRKTFSTVPAGQVPPQLLAPTQTGQPPVTILVGPRNDESIQCDCRNCQFFSGWFCAPCMMLILIVLIIFGFTSKIASDTKHDHPPPQATNTTTNTTTTTTTTTTPTTTLRPSVANSTTPIAQLARMATSLAKNTTLPKKLVTIAKNWTSTTPFSLDVLDNSTLLLGQ